MIFCHFDSGLLISWTGMGQVGAARADLLRGKAYRDR
jgi:hypothetical protein